MINTYGNASLNFNFVDHNVFLDIDASCIWIRSQLTNWVRSHKQQNYANDDAFLPHNVGVQPLLCPANLLVNIKYCFR